jgi:predicted transcriptional regulator
LRSSAKKKKPKKPTRVSVVLTDEEYARLGKMAATAERSRSWLGRYAIRRFLEEHEGRQLPLHLEIAAEG